MAAALVITVQTTLAGASAALTGGPANAAVLFELAMPSGGTMWLEAVTDSSGNASVDFVPNTVGTITGNVIQESIPVAGPVTAVVGG